MSAYCQSLCITLTFWHITPLISRGQTGPLGWCTRTILVRLPYTRMALPPVASGFDTGTMAERKCSRKRANSSRTVDISPRFRFVTRNSSGEKKRTMVDLNGVDGPVVQSDHVDRNPPTIRCDNYDCLTKTIPESAGRRPADLESIRTAKPKIHPADQDAKSQDRAQIPTSVAHATYPDHSGTAAAKSVHFNVIFLSVRVSCWSTNMK